MVRGEAVSPRFLFVGRRGAKLQKSVSRKARRRLGVGICTKENDARSAPAPKSCPREYDIELGASRASQKDPVLSAILPAEFYRWHPEARDRLST